MPRHTQTADQRDRRMTTIALDFFFLKGDLGPVTADDGGAAAARDEPGAEADTEEVDKSTVWSGLGTASGASESLLLLAFCTASVAQPLAFLFLRRFSRGFFFLI